METEYVYWFFKSLEEIFQTPNVSLTNYSRGTVVRCLVARESLIEVQKGTCYVKGSSKYEKA